MNATTEAPRENPMMTIGVVSQTEMMLRLRVQVFQLLRSSRGADARAGACDFLQSPGEL